MFCKIYYSITYYLFKAFVERKQLDDYNELVKNNASLAGLVTNLPKSEDLMTVVGRFGWGMIVLALAVWFLAWVFVTCLNVAAARQVSLMI